MKDMSLIYQMKQNRNYTIYLDELQFSFKRGDRVCDALSVFWYMYIYRHCRHCRQTYGHSKRLQTMNTTNPSRAAKS